MGEGSSMTMNAPNVWFLHSVNIGILNGISLSGMGTEPGKMIIKGIN